MWGRSYWKRSGTLTAGASVVVAVPEDASLDQFVSPAGTESEDAGDEDEESESEDAEAHDAAAEATTAEAHDAAAADGATPDDADSESVHGGSADPDLPKESTEPEPDDSAIPSEDADDSSVEPAVSTYAWSPEGGECTDCGASAEELWRSEGQKASGLVCADCKEW